MKNLSERIYWEMYKNFHSKICSEADGKMEYELQKNLEGGLSEDIVFRCHFQLLIELSFFLEKKIKHEE